MENRKKMNVLMIAQGDKGWLGGVYYIKNILFQLLKYPKANKDLNIFLYTSEEWKDIYKEFRRCSNVHFIVEKKKERAEYFDGIIEFLYGSIENKKIVDLVLKYKIDAVYPYFGEGLLYHVFLRKKCISWIADFQHIHYPNYFSTDEKKARDDEYRTIAHKHYKLVLSSEDAYRDYKSQHPDYLSNVYVVPFISYLTKKVAMQDERAKVKQKYGIAGNYFIICNQFWMHKNHMTAFKAIQRLMEKDKDIVLVCTGRLEDYRNKNHGRKIKNYIVENHLENNIKLLGMIDKSEQIQLIKGSIAVVQPSLFEGWGTGVEEAKVLGKRTVLSDIPIHHEQKNGKSILFDKFDDEALAGILEKLWNEYQGSEPEWHYSTKHAAEYGRKFYEMLYDGGEN